ncbi:MAG: glycosyltransferase family 39 protein [Candidatus Micrarchaeaceae archaeon]
MAKKKSMRIRVKNPEATALAAIMVFGFVLSMLLFKGMSFYGDDASYVQYIPSILSGSFREGINIFSIRLLMDLPLAMFVGLLGYTDLGAGAWALISYLAIMPLIYLIGKELRDARAGLIAALMFSFYPLILKFNSSPDPMLPMALFLSLSLFFFVRGKKIGSAKYYWLSGAAAFVATLANPIAYLYILFYAFYIAAASIYESMKKGSISFDSKQLYLFLGVITAIALLGYANLVLANGNPFFELNMTNSYYSAAGGPDQIFYTNPSLTYYINGYFPYGIIPFLSGNQSISSNSSNIVQDIFSLQQVQLNDVGFFGYFIAASGIYLLARRKKKAYFAILFASFIVAYMEFGSMSITHYFPIYKLMRFAVVVAVPLMLVMGFALSEFIGNAKRKCFPDFRSRAVIAAVIIIFLLATSLPMDYYYYALNHNSMLFIEQMASGLKAANLSGSNVFAAAEVPGYLAYYLGYPANVNINQYDNGAYGGLFMPTCSSIPNDTYLIIPSQAGLAEINSYNLWSVNETWAFNPAQCNLTLYANILNMSEFSNITVYSIAYSGNIYYKG